LLSGMCDATAHHFIFIMLLSHLVSRFIHVLLDCHLHIRFGHCHHTPSSSSTSTLQHLMGWYGSHYRPLERRHQSNESTPSRPLLLELIPRSLSLWMLSNWDTPPPPRGERALSQDGVHVRTDTECFLFERELNPWMRTDSAGLRLRASFAYLSVWTSANCIFLLGR
jgi:hypothetical protein